MTWLKEHRQRLAYGLIALALAATCAATAVGGVRLHDAAVVERQALRTQMLASAVFRVEDFPSSPQVLASARAAFANVATHDADQGARLRGAFEAFVRNHSDSTLSRFESLSDVESTRLAAETGDTNHRARFALIGAVICAGLLVALLVWQFELERRAGRIDRDNARRSAELVRLRDEFVAVVSHELRTPLTSIIGYLELIKRGADQASYLEVVERNAFRLASLVDDLLFAAAAEDGGLTLERQNVAVDALADEAVDAARPGAEAKKILLSRAGASDALVFGDARRLAQALDNLVSNAIKFTPEGGRVAVRTAAANGRVLVEVADTGEGITAEDQPHLFEPFFRSAEANARAVPGTGLGLTITKAIVEAHEGTIEVKSDTRTGTTMRISIPVASYAQA